MDPRADRHPEEPRRVAVATRPPDETVEDLPFHPDMLTGEEQAEFDAWLEAHAYRPGMIEFM